MSCANCKQPEICPEGFFSCGQLICPGCIQASRCPRDQSPNVSADPIVAKCVIEIKDAFCRQLSANGNQCIDRLQQYLHSTYHTQSQYPQVCSNCRQASNQTSPAFEELPSLRSPKDPGVMTKYSRPCPKCGNQFDNWICQVCHYVNLDLVETLNVEQMMSVGKIAPASAQNGYEPPNPCWACPNCGYEYNLTATCQKCQITKPGGTQPASTQSLQYNVYSTNLQQGVQSRAEQIHQSLLTQERIQLENQTVLPQGNLYYGYPSLQIREGQPYGTQSPQLPDYSAYNTQASVQTPPQYSAYPPNTAQHSHPSSYLEYITCNTCGHGYPQGSYCQKCANTQQSGNGWTCPSCGQQNPVHCGKCKQCGKLNVMAADTSAATRILAGNTLEANRQPTITQNPYWRCSSCGYEYNLPLQQGCSNCKAQRSS